MLSYNPGKVCGTCEHCWLRKVPVDLKIRDLPLEFIYDVFCNVTKDSLGGTNNSKAELCGNYIERKVGNYE